MEQLQELWQNKQVRTMVLFSIIGAAVIIIGTSMVGEDDTKSLQEITSEETKDGTVFGTSDIINQVNSQEADEMVKRMASDYERLSNEQESRVREEQRKTEEMKKRLGEVERQMFEQRQQMLALARGEGTVAPRRTAGQGRQPATTTNESTNQAPQQPVYGNTLFQRQNELITTGPLAGSPIIRTITQQSIRTLRDGEITHQNMQLSDLAARGEVDRVDPLRLGVKAPLDKLEEEGLELFTLTMGSIISGTLLNGVAAPTSSDRQDNPMPVLMRVKREAIMPNSYTLDIIDCHMLGSAIGDLSSSRVLIRAESIACNTHTGEAIEKRITAYAVDSNDGLAGVSGEVVFKTGAMIANSLKADFIAGFANALSPNRVQALNVNPSATELWQTQNLDRAAGAGVGQGLNSSASRLSDYYLNLADESHPVIELIPGIEVDFIVQTGMTLRLGGREAPYTNNVDDRSRQPLFQSPAGGSAPSIPAVPNVSINVGTE